MEREEGTEQHKGPKQRPEWMVDWLGTMSLSNKWAQESDGGWLAFGLGWESERGRKYPTLFWSSLPWNFHMESFLQSLQNPPFSEPFLYLILKGKYSGLRMNRAQNYHEVVWKRQFGVLFLKKMKAEESLHVETLSQWHDIYVLHRISSIPDISI